MEKIDADEITKRRIRGTSFGFTIIVVDERFPIQGKMQGNQVFQVFAEEANSFNSFIFFLNSSSALKN